MNEQIKALVSGLVSIVIVCAGIFGITLDQDIVATIVYVVIIIAVIVWDIWKNHNFTAAAGLAQKILDAIKRDVITEAEVTAFIEEHIDKKE